jgi:hypothetical protein
MLLILTALLVLTPAGRGGVQGGDGPLGRLLYPPAEGGTVL